MSSALCEHINLEKACSVATPLLYNMKYGLSSNESKLFTEDRSICHLPTALVKLLPLRFFSELKNSTLNSSVAINMIYSITVDFVCIFIYLKGFGF